MKHIFTYLTALLALTLFAPTFFAAPSPTGLVIEVADHEMREPGSNPNIWVMDNPNGETDIKGLGFTLKNTGNEPTTVQITANNMFLNGLETAFSPERHYNGTSTTNEVFHMTQYINGLPELVELGVGESKSFSFDLINLPNIQGEIIGGISFLQDPVEQEEVQEGVNFKSRTQYTKVVRVKNDLPEETMKLKWENAEVISKVGNPHIRFELKNLNPFVVKNDETSIRILDSKGAVVKEEKANLFIPPMAETLAEIPVSIDSDTPLKEGKYTFVFGEDEVAIPFEIKASKLRQLDPIYKDNEKQQESFPLWAALLIAALVAAVIVLLVIVLKRKK